MRVLALYYTHKPGGLCSRLYRLLNSLAVAGDDVCYLSLDEPPETLDPKVTWIRIPFPTTYRNGLLFWALFTVWLPLFTLWSALSLRPDRIVAFGAYYGAAAALAARARRTPLVLFLRSLTFKIDQITGKPAWLRSITGLVDKIGIRAASHVVCMSEAMRREVNEFLGSELPFVTVLPNDIPSLSDLPGHPHHIEEAETTVLVAGVLDLRKNVMVILEAFEILKRRGLGGRIGLIVAGDGSERERLERYAHAVSLEGVRFIGWAPSLWALLRRVDLLVHPAIHEGVPNTVLEAVAVGCPVLVSDIPEHAEFVVDKDALVSPHHAIEWADAIGRFAGDDAFKERLEEIRIKVKTKLSFDWDAEARKVVLDASWR